MLDSFFSSFEATQLLCKTPLMDLLSKKQPSDMSLHPDHYKTNNGASSYHGFLDFASHAFESI